MQRLVYNKFHGGQQEWQNRLQQRSYGKLVMLPVEGVYRNLATAWADTMVGSHEQ